MAKAKSANRGGGKAAQARNLRQQAAALLQANRLEEARATFEQLCALDKSDADAWYTLGGINGMLDRLDEAITCTRKAIRLRPRHAEAHNNLGMALEKRGELEQASEHYRRAVALQPQYAEAHKNLGNVLAGLHRDAEAEKSYRRALQLRPDYLDAHNDLGNALRRLERHEEALERFDHVLQMQPGYVRAYINRGVALESLGRLDEAFESYQRAAELQPDDAGIYNNIGNLVSGMGYPEQSLDYYDRALAIQPDLIEAYINRANALQLLNRHDQAIGLLERALAIDPDQSIVHNNLGNILRDKGRLAEAVEHFDRARVLRPDFPEAVNNLGIVLTQQGRYAEADTCYRRAVELRPSYLEAYSNLLLGMNYDPGYEAAELLAAHRGWEERHGQCAPVGEPTDSPDPDTDPERRLRIGYVSPDLRGHSVAYFIEPILAAHDPEQVEVFCYAEVRSPDATTERLKGYAQHWHNTCGLTDAQLAEQIRADNIDLLVDLAGHTAHHRLGAFAHRPAPVQITYLGYPNTTGLSTIDYRLTDAWADPDDQDAFHSETLVRLPEGFLCYRPPSDAPDVAPLPAQHSGQVTFGSFNNLAKITPQVIAAWARLLVQVPGARLLLKNKSLADEQASARVRELFAGHGIDADRLELIGWQPDPRDHLALYARIDIALDTFPYNGTTTTCEALWMGVPVLTLAGSRHAGRVGLSLLARTGLEELAADGVEDYIERARALAADTQRLGALRASLRDSLADSTLCQPVPFTRTLETTYRRLWQQWCERQTNTSMESTS